MFDSLFTPFVINHKTIKNRICFPSVGLMQDGDADTGAPTAGRIAHYERIAAGGPGLVVVGITAIQKNARLRPGEFGLWSEASVEAFRRLADVIHRHGATAVVQLHHAGARVQPSVFDERVAPSEIARFGARAMTFSEIQRLREDFIQAAVRAQKAGFDGVELHAAHGYLLSLFVSPRYNQRQDEYGGGIEGRVRLQAEILQGIHAACGPNFIAACRIGGNEPGYEEGVAIAKRLEAAGADYISVSFGLDDHYDLDTSYWLPAPGPEGFDGNYVVYGASCVRRAVKVPVIAVRSIHTPERGAWLIENGHADMVAYARPMLTNPDFVHRIQQGVTPFTECLDCPVCQWFQTPERCPVERRYNRDFYRDCSR